MNKIITMLIILNFALLGFAHNGFLDKTENIIKQRTPCSELTEEQFDLIGDFYMEQIHPGEQHNRMDEMMGGKGSESLKQIHMSMAKAFYCGEHEAMSQGMMQNMMGGMMNNNGVMDSGNGMMNSSGLMGSKNDLMNSKNEMPQGMINPNGMMNSGNGMPNSNNRNVYENTMFWGIHIISIVILILVVWLGYNFLNKRMGENKK